MDVELRPLTAADLPLLHRWLNEPGVVRWWEGDDVSWAAVLRDYHPDGDDPSEHWLASVDARPAGWIQCYAIADYLDEDEVKHWIELGIERSAGGIDYLVAPGRRGQGLGTTMIRSFVEEVVFPQHPTWTSACASPVAANVASWRALEKAGFGFVGGFTDTHGPCRLYRRARER
jgi:aminoglycoside 6'-N-acetyltransferase